MGLVLSGCRRPIPQKVIAETENIFKQVDQVNHAADKDRTSLRKSIDAKTAVKAGEYDRREKHGW